MAMRHPADHPLDAGDVSPHRLLSFSASRSQVRGTRSDVTPTLFVCNHVSYLDIEVLGGLVPGSFVAKAEVATWPFFSTLAKAQRTDLHRAQLGEDQRQPRRDDAAAEYRRQSDAVPRGHQQRRHARAAVPQRSLRRGSAAARRQADRGAAGRDRLHAPRRHSARPLLAAVCSPGSAIWIWFRHLWQMVCLGETEAVVTFFPPIDIDQLGDRKKLAEFCFRQVSLGVQAANSGASRPFAPAGLIC